TVQKRTGWLLDGPRMHRDSWANLYKGGTQELYFGVTRYNPPGLASSIIQTAPSGPTATSRTRCPTGQRSAGVAPPLPSNVMRLSVKVAMPPISAEPCHCGNIAPL